MNVLKRIAAVSLVLFSSSACLQAKQAQNDTQTQPPTPSSASSPSSSAPASPVPSLSPTPPASPVPSSSASSPASATSSQSARNVPGEFDYYVLALSWSPDYCSSHPQDTQQCGTRRYGFVLHGLWPKYEKGYPQSCSKAPLPPEARQAHADLYPNDDLMEHEWQKHGTCSGLSANDYLDLSEHIKQSVQIPARYQAPAEPFRTTIGEVRIDLKSVNSDLPDDSITMVCSGSGQYLKELRICHDKSGHAKGCSQDVVKQMTTSCAKPDFLVKSVR